MQPDVHAELINMLRKRLRHYQSQATKAASREDATYWLRKAGDIRCRIREMRAAQQRAVEGGDFVPDM